jgi:hypothetical protein
MTNWKRTLRTNPQLAGAECASEHAHTITDTIQDAAADQLGDYSQDARNAILNVAVDTVLTHISIPEDIDHPAFIDGVESIVLAYLNAIVPTDEPEPENRTVEIDGYPLTYDPETGEILLLSDHGERRLLERGRITRRHDGLYILDPNYITKGAPHG